MFMKILKIIFSIIAVVVLLYLFIVFFSGKTTTYACEGNVKTSSGEYEQDAFVELVEYRWWVGLWSDSDASVWIETPKPDSWTYYYGHVTDSGSMLNLFGGQSNNELEGNYKKLSGQLSFNTVQGIFSGTCAER